MGRIGRSITLSLLVACGSSSDDSAPPGPTPLPPDDPGTITGTPLDGVFVSSKGTPSGDGSIYAPLSTISAGIARAVGVGKPVYVCAEKFAESVTLVSGVSVYGYFDCKDPIAWFRTTAHASIVSPTTPAVIAKSLAIETRFEGFDVLAPDLSTSVATETEGSSIALYVRDSTRFLITSCSFRSGNAAPGIDGTEPALNVEASDTNGKAGKAEAETCSSVYGPVTCANSIPGSAGGTSTCKTPETSGGPGGAGGDGPIAGGNGGDPHGRPSAATTHTAAGGAGRTAALPVAGLPGDPGTPGADGTNGSWAFDLDGYRLTPATAGKDGAGGQGGGGGGSQTGYTNNGTSSVSPNGSTTATSATGSGGGAGGCGGLAGNVGTGGGASVAALIVNSDVKMTDTKLDTGVGGAAGRGTVGTLALTGGGPGTAPMWAATGGGGGTGGASGLSGNGAAGPSIALVYKGTRPTTVNVILTPGLAGRGQPALAKGAKTLPAVAGESKEELQF